MLTDAIQLAWHAHTWQSCHVVVAVSGGADSVALLRALAEIHHQNRESGQLIVAHFNHGLRASMSDADQAWVVDLAQSLDLDVEVAREKQPEQLRSEDLARSARYHWLQQVAQQRGARYVATAHTADDQAETVLMRVLRGSGIDGLAGIPARRRLTDSITLVRPLLQVSRQAIEQYLDQLGQTYRVDASNAESLFTRNWVRNELLPLLRARLPSDPDRSLVRLAQQASQCSTLLDSLAEPLIEQSVAIQGNRIEISTAPVVGQPTIVVSQMARLAWRMAGWPEQAMGFAEWQRLAEAILAPPTASFTLPGEVHVVGCDGKYVLEKR